MTEMEEFTSDVTHTESSDSEINVTTDNDIVAEATEDPRTPIRDNEQRPTKVQSIQEQHDKQSPKYVTEGGKEINIVKDTWGTFWHIEFASGGQLPASLSGSFTDEKSADLAVRLYLAVK